MRDGFEFLGRLLGGFLELNRLLVEDVMFGVDPLAAVLAIVGTVILFGTPALGGYLALRAAIASMRR